MKKFLTAIVLTIALPTVAHAQSAPAPAAEMDCCDKMKAEGKECACCKDMDHSKMDHSKMDHSKMDHSKMDHSKMDHSSMGDSANPASDPHAGHDMSSAGQAAAPAPAGH